MCVEVTEAMSEEQLEGLSKSKVKSIFKYWDFVGLVMATFNFETISTSFFFFRL